MLLPKEHAAEFIATYANLLHYAGVACGIVPENTDAESFVKLGPEMLIKCRIALFQDMGLLDEFRADALDNATLFEPILTAVEHARPTLLFVLRDTPEHSICLDLAERTFCHVKSLNDPLGASLQEHHLARAVLMTYKGQVMHDGLVIAEPMEEPITEARKQELDAAYQQALTEGAIQAPWGPGHERLRVEDLSQDAVSATLSNAALIHPKFREPFISIAGISVNEDAFLEMSLDAVQVMRGNPEPHLAQMELEGATPDTDQFLFALDRMEGDIKAVLRRSMGKRAKQKAMKPRERPAAMPAPTREPVTLAERLNAATPFTATGTRELTQVMREQGTPITLKTALTVERVEEGPVEAGITCVLQSTSTGVQFAAPLTYLLLPASSPFFREVEDWRRKRHKIIARLNARYR